MNKLHQLLGGAAICFGLLHPAMTLADGPNESVIGPEYHDAPEVKAKPGVPVGDLHRFKMDSADTKMYPGIAKNKTGVVPYKRDVVVYVPKQYVAGTAAPFMVIHDGPGYVKGTAPVLDNMIADHRLPAMIAVFLNHGGGDGPGSERGLEYDTMSGKYAEFIENEVLPRVEKECNVKLTKDPEGRAAMGGSSGSSAALSMAWYHPELYHKVLSYSGTFVNQQSPANPESPHGAWEYHEHLIPQIDAKPIRIWMEVGEKDNGATRDEASFHNWVMANQRMAAVLKAKGYQYKYVYALAGKHVDRRVVNQTLPEALAWLWEGYAAK